MFSSRKNKAINSYLKALPKMMTSDYGKSIDYSALQVIKSIERYKFNAKHQAYAVALHCSEEEFFSYFNDDISKSEYQQIRDELSMKYFDGHDFTSRDVSKYSSPFSNNNDFDATIDEWVAGPDGCGDGGD